MPSAGRRLAGLPGYGSMSSLDGVQGLYLVKFAVAIMAFYLAMQLLISFADVLLPFIFAVLLGSLLEPWKMFILRILKALSTHFFLCLNMKVCLEGAENQPEAQYSTLMDRPGSTDSEAYVVQAEESMHPGKRRQLQPVESIRKLNLAIAIVLCLVMTGRVMWLIIKVFYRSGQQIAGSVSYYQKGTYRIKLWTQNYIKNMHMEQLDWGSVLDDLIEYLNQIAEMTTESLTDALMQASFSLIFLLYLLWSPVKVPENSITQDVFKTASRYLKIKTLISAFAGFSVFLTLWLLGLELAPAFGLLTFLLRFLPGIGDLVASVLPCVLGIIDVRKSPTQVLFALVLTLSINFGVQLIVEPVWFNVSMEIHSVVVILGVFFLREVWGVPGMLLSVPLLAITRLLLKILKKEVSGEDAATIQMFDNVLEGKWMATLGGDPRDDTEKGQEFSIDGRDGPPLLIEDDTQQPAEGTGLCVLLNNSPVLKQAYAAVEGFYQTYRLAFDMIFLTIIMVIVWVPQF